MNTVADVLSKLLTTAVTDEGHNLYNWSQLLNPLTMRSVVCLQRVNNNSTEKYLTSPGSVSQQFCVALCKLDS